MATRTLPILVAAILAAGCSPSVDAASSSGTGGASAGVGGSSGAGGASGARPPHSGANGWAWPVDAGDDARVLAVAVDSQGNVVLGGTFQGDLRFPTEGPTCRKARTCGFVAELAPDGSVRWMHPYLAADDSAAAVIKLALAIGPADDVVVTGSHAGKVDFGDGAIGAGPREV